MFLYKPRGISALRKQSNKRKKPRKIGAYGGGCEIRTHAPVKANGFQEVYQRIPFPLSSGQFRLKQSLKILILQGFSGLFGTDMN